MTFCGKSLGLAQKFSAAFSATCTIEGGLVDQEVDIGASRLNVGDTERIDMPSFRHGGLV